MELSIHEIERIAEKTIVESRRIGESAWYVAATLMPSFVDHGVTNAVDGVGGLLDTFRRPEIAAEAAEIDKKRREREENLAEDLEEAAGDRATKHHLARSICTRTVALLKVPEEDAPADRGRRLASALAAFDDQPMMYVGVRSLGPQDRQLLGEFLTEAQ